MARLARLHDLVTDALGHVRRDGEADTDVSRLRLTGTGGRDSDVDSDELALVIDQSTTRVAWVDGGIRLDNTKIYRCAAGAVPPLEA